MSYARAALLLSLPLLLGATPAPGGWSAVPSGGGRPAFYAEGVPGTVLQDTVSVVNRGTRTLTVRLTGTGLPVRFARTAVDVPARTRADVPFTVSVPGDAGPGERTGEIVVRESAGRRIAVPLLVRIEGPELAALTVEHVAVRADRITYELVNRGTTDLAPRLAVRAEGVFGTVLDRPSHALPVHLPPGRRLRLTEPWPGRPALDAVTVHLTATAPGTPPATARTTTHFVPWGALAAGTATALAAAAAALTVVRRRGRGRDAGARGVGA
ncbi:hypothetical protein [Streptomyces sp. Amel2xC10]|uniref:hypothetical protein n=1 Tax=Streptomyces sp. Amel2xC10 TaxID=1305826 RepID=UPI000A086E9A|nr:hypothetical protein [Streptomyces sp. Amel2xC10]SMF59332.1 hypothetical protein SAMN02745830_04702 [Streptomyces sp. Amel2xC10]